MTPNDFKRLLYFLRHTEKELKKETFLFIFGHEWEILWENYRSFDYSLGVFFECISEEHQKKLCFYLSKHHKDYENNRVHG